MTFTLRSPRLRFACGLVLSGWGGGALLTAAEPEPVMLQLPFTHQFQFAGVYAAIEQGYFLEEGLDVTVRPTSIQHHAPVEDVLAGRADFGLAQGPQLIAARLAGHPVVAVAAIFQHSPQVLLTRAQDNLSTPQDLIGKRVALDDASLQSEIRLMLEREGVGFDRITVLPIDWAANELLEGKSDAMAGFITDLPFTMRRLGVPVRIIRPADYGVDFYGDCLFTSEAQLHDRPDRALRMRRALLRGWEYALRHREEMIRLILERYTSKPRGLAQPLVDADALRYEAGQVALLISADLVEPGRINLGRWQRMAEVIRGYSGQGDISRIEEMLYEPPLTASERLRTFAPVLLWGLGAALVVAVAAGFANRRLQSLVRRRTEELAVANQRQREYFELAPAPIVIEDYRGVVPILNRLRSEGVSDLRAHLGANPELQRELFRHKRVVAANRLALVRTGFDTVEEMDRELGDIMSTQAMEMFVEELAALWAGNDQLTMEKVYETKLGETVHTLVKWEISRKDGERDLANVRLVFTEVTQQKVTEQALRESEERYRLLFEQAVSGIYRASPEGQFMSVNPALARILGYDRPDDLVEWARTHTLRALYVRPQRRDEFVATLKEKGEVRDFESEVRANGGTRWISENARAVRDEQGRLLFFEGFATDITARRQLEGEMARASKLEAVGILAGGIAHDFNNILTVVLGNISLIETDIPAGSPLAARLADAKKATLRARDLTLQLLTFAKGGEPVKSNVDLPELVREAANFALHGAKARGDFQFPRGIWAVSADKGQLGQVVQNLVINAVQAMPDGGVVTLKAENVHLGESGPSQGPPLAPGRYVHVQVGDNGTGIAREHLAKIFDPYFTTKEQGSGLGLATAYSIINKHGGHIVAESEPGRGTVFHVWLPASPSSGSTPSVSAGSSRTPFRVRVLFMDDENAIRTMARIFMERIGYDCDVASDGAEAVRKYEEAMATGRRYEVVIMDLTVPGGLGGREAMEQLLKLDSGVCAIVSSGYSRDPVLANYRSYGFRAILPKPYGLEQLTKVMHAVLDGVAMPG